jgi:Septum formation initiator.
MKIKTILLKLNNKYVYATLVFLVVILFVDQFNVFDQIRLSRTLKSQKRQIQYYKDEISKNQKLLEDMKTDTALLEKIAREEYKMKRDNEVIYLIETQK